MPTEWEEEKKQYSLSPVMALTSHQAIGMKGTGSVLGICLYFSLTLIKADTGSVPRTPWNIVELK